MTLTRLAGPVAAGLLAATGALAQEGAPADNVSVTRVTLATGGLAHVEGTMTQDGEIMRLAVDRPLVADVLRTLIVTGEAPVVSIDLPAAEPVGARSRVGRLLAGDLADPATILQSLIGEMVDISAGPVSLSGRLVAFTPVTVPGSDEVPEEPGVRIAVATEDGGIDFATVPALDQVRIAGAAAAGRMEALVPALGQTVDEGVRALSVRLAQTARAGFSFVVPTTVWRPSYRALIDADGAVTLQGWATLENTTGLDWDDVDLSLAVGTPVAYRQDVYSPLRTERPQAPFAVGRTAETGVVAGEFQEAPPRMEAAPRRAQRSLAAMPAMADSAEPAALATAGPAEAGRAATVFPVAGAIDLDAGRTLTVPFLDRTENVGRIAYVDLRADARPMDALEIAFDPEATVPGGLVAVHEDGRFVGDARFAGADGGESRILPFALSADLDARITERSSRTLARASLSDGVLRLTRQQDDRTILDMAADEPITLVADVARTGNETVAVTAERASAGARRLAEGLARVRADLPAGESRLTVTITRPLTETYQVTNVPGPVIEEVLSAGDTVDEHTRQALRRLAGITSRLAEIRRRIGTLEADVADLREAIAADRKDLRAIGADTAEGAAIRQRIIERRERADAMLEELRTLRQERLDQEERLRRL